MPYDHDNDRCPICNRTFGEDHDDCSGRPGCPTTDCYKRALAKVEDSLNEMVFQAATSLIGMKYDDMTADQKNLVNYISNRHPHLILWDNRIVVWANGTGR